MKTVRIIGSAIGYGTKVTDAETGSEVKGVEAFAIPKVEADDIIRVVLTVGLAEIDVGGEARFQMIDPRDGKERVIKRVEFEDADPFEPA